MPYCLSLLPLGCKWCPTKCQGQEGQHHFSVVADYVVVQYAMLIDFHIYIAVVDPRAVLSKHDM